MAKKIRKAPECNKYDAIVIGNVSYEKNIDHLQNVEQREGGSIIYSVHSGISNDFKLAVVTKLSKNNEYLLDSLTARNVDLFVKHCKNTTFTQNEILDLESEKIKTQCFCRADPIYPNDIPNLDSYFYLFVGDFLGDIPLETIKHCANRGYVALDANCFLKRINPNTNEVRDVYYEDFEVVASYCDMVKLSMEQAELVTGEYDALSASKVIKSWGVKEILIVDKNIMHLYDENNEYWEVAIKDFSKHGILYLGTTTFIAYVCSRITSDAQMSLFTAGSTAMYKLSRPGPARCSRAEINFHLETFYYTVEVLRNNLKPFDCPDEDIN